MNMKKTLLLSALALMSIIALNAQTKIWNLGGDPTVTANGSPAFPLTTGIGIGDGSAGNPAFPVMINGLGITGISTNLNMGGVNASVKSFTDASSVTYNFVNRFQFNGAGYTGALNTDVTPSVFVPTQRFLSFNVAGNSIIYAIGVTGSSTSARAMFVTDGTKLIGSMAFPAATVYNDATVNYTGPATTLYVFCNSSINLALLSATNYVATSTAVKTVLADQGVTFNGTEIVNSKGLAIEVYSVLGKQVATSNMNISTTNFQKGVYIVRLKGTSDSMKIAL